jgi:hypothetical protein
LRVRWDRVRSPIGFVHRVPNRIVIN